MSYILSFLLAIFAIAVHADTRIMFPGEAYTDIFGPNANTAGTVHLANPATGATGQGVGNEAQVEAKCGFEFRKQLFVADCVNLDMRNFGENPDPRWPGRLTNDDTNTNCAVRWRGQVYSLPQWTQEIDFANRTAKLTCSNR